MRTAQKACSNTHILRLLRKAGAAVDCVTLGELERAIRAGFESSEIVFTADVLPRDVLQRVLELKVPVNAGSEDMLEQLGRVSPGHPVWIRVNPGFGHGDSKKTNTGEESSKHGIWHENLPQALALVTAYNLDLVGLHTHIGSGADITHLERMEASLGHALQLEIEPGRYLTAQAGVLVSEVMATKAAGRTPAHATQRKSKP